MLNPKPKAWLEPGAKLLFLQVFCRTRIEVECADGRRRIAMQLFLPVQFASLMLPDLVP